MSAYKYSNKELIKREQIIQSQIQFGKFLDADIINHLVHLLNTNIMSGYIEDERKKSNLSNDTIKIKCESYGELKKNSSLYIGVIKNGIDFLHLTMKQNKKKGTRKVYKKAKITQNHYADDEYNRTLSP